MSCLVTDAPGTPGTSVARVGLTLAGIVLAAVVIFGLGVMEGSRVAKRGATPASPPGEPPTETLRTPPPAAVAPAVPIPPDKLTFYDRLSGIAAPAPVALPEDQPPAPGLAPAALPEAQGAAARQAAAPAPPAAAGTASRTAGPSKTGATAQIRKLAGKGRFTVQMAAVSERSAAAEMAARIKRDGFDAVTTTTSVKGKLLYRVRVGSFPNKQAAAQAAGIFRSAFEFDAIAMEN